MKNYNRTIKFGPDSQPEFHTKRTTSGLWIICISKVGDHNLSCSPINYFPVDKYRPDDQDSTHAIPYSARNSSTYFILSFIFLLTGEFFFIITFLKSSKKIFAFLSGVSFVVGGLITLVGIINYISIFKAEVGNKLYSRSMLAEPVFTYNYGYSFAVLILSFLLSELTGICAIFQFIYYHQYKWDQIEKNNVLENSVNAAGKDPNSCKIIATMSNGTIKTLCDNKDNVSVSESLSEMMSKKLESESGALESSPSTRLVPNTYKVQQKPSLHQTTQSSDCNCSLIYQNQEVNKAKYMTSGGESAQCYNHLVYVPHQNTLSSITTETTGFSSSSLCSPNYQGPANGQMWTEASNKTANKTGLSWTEMANNSTNNWVASLKVPSSKQQFVHGLIGGESSNGSDTSEERRKRVTRHISIDDTPITHTYHQNSLESSSESSHSPSEESSADTSNSQYSSQFNNTLDRNFSKTSSKLINGETKGSQQKTHTLPSSARINKTLKSSLSKTSSLRRPTNYKFETDDSLQQIVKQKRENCLQNGLSLSRESIADVFDDDNIVSLV